MKRLLMICLAIAVVGISSNLSAEEGPDGKGIRAGYQNSFLKIDGEKFGSANDGFYIGFFKSNNIVPLLKWNTGLEYYQVGSNSKEGDIKLHYLSVPVSLKLKLGPVYGFAGVNGAIKLGGSSDFEAIGAGVSDFSTLDAGTHLGLGFKFLMLGIEAKYNWGLVNQTDGDFRSEYLQVGAVLFF